MNCLGNKPQPRILKVKALHEGFEGAVVANVAKAASIKHVERNCISMASWIFVESELRKWIDVARDEPRRRNAIDPGLGPSNPSSTDVIFGALLPVSRFFFVIIALELSYTFFYSGTYGSAEEVNLHDLL